ncbi:MAG: hypothetical protein AAF764_12220, partial [Pseudomonadota bacterium]
MSSPLDITRAGRLSRVAHLSLLRACLASTALCFCLSTTAFAEGLVLRGSSADPAVAQPSLRGTTSAKPQTQGLSLKPSLGVVRSSSPNRIRKAVRKPVPKTVATPTRKATKAGETVAAPEHMGAYNGPSRLGDDPFAPGEASVSRTRAD